MPTLWSLWQKIPYPWHDRRITESEIPGLGKPVWDCSSQPLTNPPLLIVIIIAFFLAKIHPICHAILAKSTLSIFSSVIIRITLDALITDILLTKNFVTSCLL